MKKENKKAYILYNYNKFSDDYEFIKEYYSIKEIQEEIKTLKNKRSIYHYITDSIENVKQLMQDQYIIIKEDI